MNEPEQSRNQGMATGSLVCGILSLTCLSVLAGIPAIILGHVAVARVSSDPELHGGKDRAVAGLIMGYLSVLFLFLLAAVLIAVPAPADRVPDKAALPIETVPGISGLSDLTSRNDPVEIFGVVQACIAQERFDDAALAYGLAAAYGDFDSRRVADQTAHQAIRVLQLNFGMDLAEDQAAALQESLDALLENPERLIAFVEKIGRPEYSPAYMIQHGMDAYSGNV